jgi:hypothetical protein
MFSAYFRNIFAKGSNQTEWEEVVPWSVVRALYKNALLQNRSYKPLHWQYNTTHKYITPPGLPLLKGRAVK